MSTCVHFSTFPGTIFTVGTRCRLRFAATCLFWTYCISQGIVRVCPFANLLIGPWLEIEPSAIEQFQPNAERFTDVWAMTYFCTAPCSLLAIYSLMEANFQQFFCWGHRLHFQAGGYASFWRASAFRCGSCPAQLVFRFWELSHFPHVAAGECNSSVETNIEGTVYQWRLISAN